MLDAIFSKKNFRIVSFLWILLIAVFLQAQEKWSIPDVEKIYLHTDRSSYIMGEDLWYKAYNVFAFNNLLFNNSNLLYVELISSDSKIVARNITELSGGLGHGDFKLVDSLGVKPGVYQLRAYTNWNRNFKNDFVFKKVIEIIDVFEMQTEKNEEQKHNALNKNPANGTQNTFKIDFFPEGGSLLENVSSVVGIKAVDVNGNPITVQGEIFNSDGELVTLFLSTHYGMGKFQMTPIKGKRYYAKIKIPNGTFIEQELPKVNSQGYLLSFKTFKGRNIFTIKTNQETLTKNLNMPLRFIFKSKGLSYFEGTQLLTKTIMAFELPAAKVPEGIAQITLQDGNSKPQSERLVFLEKDDDLDVKLVTDKSSYKINEKTTINLSLKSKKGEAKSASFSLSVTDMNGLEDEADLDSNICSYFLMESDIRGKVHNPGYYFDKSNPRRLEHLDLLLLTQGWRDFLWKTFPKVNDSITYIAEKGITISGRVEQLFGEKPKANINMTLALMNERDMKILNAVTDSLGIFKFEDLLFKGKTNMFLNSRNEKGKSKGEIILYPIKQAPLQVNLKKSDIMLPEKDNAINMIVENVYKKYVTHGVVSENVLDEVEIIAKKRNNTTSLYGTPDFSYVVDENTPIFNDIYQLIQYKIPGVMVVGNSVQFMRFNEPAHFILDGFPVFNQADLDFIQPDDVEKIDAIKGPSAGIFGPDGANGIIAIYTKDGASNTSEKEDFHTIKQEIDGLYNARVFYSPNPEKPNLELDQKEVVRNTL